MLKVRESRIICGEKLYMHNAISVFAQKCTSSKCDGYLSYDGKEQCLINMKHLLFTYEVLRQFMFHFVMGRYVYTLLYIVYIKFSTSLTGLPSILSTTY